MRTSWLHASQRARVALDTAEFAAITFVQRFGSSLDLNVHLHVVVVDGVFSREQDELAFTAASPPTRAMCVPCRSILEDDEPHAAPPDTHDGSAVEEAHYNLEASVRIAAERRLRPRAPIAILRPAPTVARASNRIAIRQARISHQETTQSPKQAPDHDPARAPRPPRRADPTSASPAGPLPRRIRPALLITPHRTSAPEGTKSHRTTIDQTTIDVPNRAVNRNPQRPTERARLRCALKPNGSPPTSYPSSTGSESAQALSSPHHRGSTGPRSSPARSTSTSSNAQNANPASKSRTSSTTRKPRQESSTISTSPGRRPQPALATPPLSSTPTTSPTFPVLIHKHAARRPPLT